MFGIRPDAGAWRLAVTQRFCMLNASFRYGARGAVNARMVRLQTEGLHRESATMIVGRKPTAVKRALAAQPTVSM